MWLVFIALFLIPALHLILKNSHILAQTIRNTVSKLYTKMTADQRLLDALDQTRKDDERQLEEWRESHPGYDESNPEFVEQMDMVIGSYMLWKIDNGSNKLDKYVSSKMHELDED